MSVDERRNRYLPIRQNRADRGTKTGEEKNLSDFHCFLGVRFGAMWIAILFALLVGYTVGYGHAIINAYRNLKAGEGRTWKRAIHDAMPMSHRTN